ncbi:MAG: FAD-dependent oxidoreductase, partial [Desulfobacteraceae bacterium]|nr:FAD-dependent oxidoreductase [Desulfobacteraceae bacterium]
MKKLLILGGGTGGTIMANKMRHALDREEWDITIVDKEKTHFYQPGFLFIPFGFYNKHDVVKPKNNFMPFGVNFIIQQIDQIEPEKNQVLLADGVVLKYDYLIIATGSRTDFPVSIDGLEKYSHGVKTLQRAFEFKQQFEYQLYERMQSEEDLFCKAFNVVIGGAGLSGVEIAAEMGHYAKQFIQDNRMLCDGIQVYLIASGERVLDGMNPYLQTKTEQRLNELGVRVIYNTRITEVKEDSVMLNNGTHIDFDFMIFAGGVKASTLAESLGCELNAKGQVT